MAEEQEQKPAKPAPAAPAAPPAKTKEEVLADPIVADVTSAMPGAFLNAKDAMGELSLYVALESIVDVCAAFKARGFTYLVDLCGTDYSTYPGHAGDRFCVNYLLYSFKQNVRVRLKVFVADGASVPSVTGVWKTANWHEREVFDMFGIPFTGHTNLERILMWEGFNVSAPMKTEKKSVTLEELISFPMVFREEGSGTRKEGENILVSQGISFQDMKVAGIFGSTDAVKQAVKAGLGVSILSKFSVADELEHGLLEEIRLTDIQMKRCFYIVTHKKRTLPRLYDIFLKHILAAKNNL